MFNGLTAQQTLRNRGHRLGLSVVTLLAMWASPLVSKAVAMPAHFTSYAMTDIGGGLRCIVGNTTDEGLNGRAYVYVVALATHKVRWVTRVPLTPDSYQNRATHCLADDSKVYALDQTDTSYSQALPKTLVDVAVLDRVTGHINSAEKVIAK